MASVSPLDVIGAAALVLTIAFIVWGAVRAVERDAEHARRIRGRRNG